MNLDFVWGRYHYGQQHGSDPGHAHLNILHPIQLNLFKHSHRKIAFPWNRFLPSDRQQAESLNNLLSRGTSFDDFDFRQIRNKICQVRLKFQICIFSSVI